MPAGLEMYLKETDKQGMKSKCGKEINKVAVFRSWGHSVVRNGAFMSFSTDKEESKHMWREWNTTEGISKEKKAVRVHIDRPD